MMCSFAVAMVLNVATPAAASNIGPGGSGPRDSLVQGSFTPHHPSPPRLCFNSLASIRA